MHRTTTQPRGNVDFNDPASLAAYYRTHPKRCGPQLAAFKRLPLQAPFSGAIKAAGELLRTKP